MNTDYLIDLFIRIAKIDALSGNEKPLAEFIKSFLSKFNYNISEDDSKLFSGSNTGNLICKIGEGGSFIMTAHLDTARPTLNIKPKILEDKIVSSGDTVLGVDNRAGVTVLLFLLEKIAKEKIPVKDFTVVFTTCEETTLFGSKYLGVNGNIKYGFVFDSGYRPGNFIYSACGAMGFKMKVIGKASHSGISPEKGINSLLIASRAINNLPLGRIDDESTMNIGILKGGSAVNVIPEITELNGEIRSFDLQKVEHYLNVTIAAFRKEADILGGKIEVESFWDFKPYTIPENSFVFKEIVRVMKQVGLNPIPKISLGGSDANSLNEKGIQSVNLGIGAQNPHSNDEFIFIEDLVKSAEIALELVKK
ncbi:MAG: M20/M25/M40 family metallo-hydrolase [Ignavibacteriota bacterium]|nr:MAG: M20/M25/M40 family metallo-hydrolase [Chlorobiota bacterium]MBE7477053.1 M20/M25/M40 family metallo-hydrolase [Ignavibacteriales bacterium]MBL1121255.1 M20/M25/M40 family metallo-hydrolase [Ignavibacteriota bacterium]MCC7095207.1 M20/M25/M40 family metallo-hydrolase [Ignavibacteriaceae bacterium]MCE7856496.1 M20/M25/M40 family metallo-hydrolase [Ignavibacteria bacterium CHB3]